MQLKTHDEILEHLRRDVYVRLRVSNHGVGVFAIRQIPYGLDPFQERAFRPRFVKVSAHAVMNDPDIAESVKQYAHDMCQVQDGFVWMPAHGLNRISPIFYLNHSETPNMQADRNAHFSTKRIIEVDEELTIDYRTYNDELGL